MARLHGVLAWHRKPAIHLQADALARCAAAEKVRRELHNTILDLKGAIRVFVRVRPAADEAQAAVRVGDGGSLELQIAQGRKASTTAFSFDRVFAPSAPQACGCYSRALLSCGCIQLLSDCAGGCRPRFLRRFRS